MSDPVRDDSVLQITGLDAYYGSAHALHGLSCSVGERTTGIIGRNGMGKSTLCNVIMGLPPAKASGSITFGGTEILGKQSYDICREGLAFVPQGRRIFPSLTTDEHLRMLSKKLATRGRWTVDAVYDLYPRLADRRKVGAALLSGGEQQMLAIARALLTAPDLLILDEPSIGLAPKVVAEVYEQLDAIRGGGITLLIVEQNTSALRLASRVYVLSNGSIVSTGPAEQYSDADVLAASYLATDT